MAHRLTVIVLQAEAAQRVWESQPVAARGALTALAEVARGTLGELRVALEHGPTVAGLDELLGRVRALGVEVTVTGAAEALDPDLFTVLREALTNAVRHAAPTQAAVELRPDGVVVTDCGGPGSGVQGTGNGLRGLAERLSLRGVAYCGTARWVPAIEWRRSCDRPDPDRRRPGPGARRPADADRRRARPRGHRRGHRWRAGRALGARG